MSQQKCNKEGCSCSCHGEQAQNRSKECHQEHDECCALPKQLLDLADKAWMELLKEKIKTKINAASGDTLDKLAQLLTEVNHERWAEIFASKKHCEDYKKRICDFFNKK